MSMLLEPDNNMAYAKIGLYGRAGAGKTYTAAQVAIGLYKYAKCDKPIAMFDTEPAWVFIKKYFVEAGIKFVVYDKSRALADVMRFMEEAEQKCSIIIIDSVTHIWRDCCDSYLKKLNQGRSKKISRLEFHHWNPIKSAFGQFTDKYLTCKAHTIICGRAGDIYEYQQNDETHKKELITNGMRMATEKELGHEPSLLIEMFTEREDDKVINKCLVIKDRNNKINGKIFNEPTFETFKPHIEALNIGGEHFESLAVRDSQEMFTETGDDQWGYEKRQREIWCEEVQGLLLKYYPSRKEADIQAKSDLLQEIFNTRSWTKIQNFNSENIKAGFQRLQDKLEIESKRESVEMPELTPEQQKEIDNFMES